MTEGKSSGGGRLLTFAAWSVLVLGLWLWGRQITGVPAPLAGQAGAAVGPGLPAARAPSAGSCPSASTCPP